MPGNLPPISTYHKTDPYRGGPAKGFPPLRTHRPPGQTRLTQECVSFLRRSLFRGLISG